MSELNVLNKAMRRNESDSKSSEEDAFHSEVKWKDINRAEIHFDAEEFSDSAKKVHSEFFSHEERSTLNLFRVASIYIT